MRPPRPLAIAVLTYHGVDAAVNFDCADSGACADLVNRILFWHGIEGVNELSSADHGTNVFLSGFSKQWNTLDQKGKSAFVKYLGIVPMYWLGDDVRAIESAFSTVLNAILEDHKINNNKQILCDMLDNLVGKFYHYVDTLCGTSGGLNSPQCSEEMDIVRKSTYLLLRAGGAVSEAESLEALQKGGRFYVNAEVWQNFPAGSWNTCEAREMMEQFLHKNEQINILKDAWDSSTDHRTLETVQLTVAHAFTKYDVDDVLGVIGAHGDNALSELDQNHSEWAKKAFWNPSVRSALLATPQFEEVREIVGVLDSMAGRNLAALFCSKLATRALQNRETSCKQVQLVLALYHPAVGDMLRAVGELGKFSSDASCYKALDALLGDEEELVGVFEKHLQELKGKNKRLRKWLDASKLASLLFLRSDTSIKSEKLADLYEDTIPGILGAAEAASIQLMQEELDTTCNDVPKQETDTNESIVLLSESSEGIVLSDDETQEQVAQVLDGMTERVPELAAAKKSNSNGTPEAPLDPNYEAPELADPDEGKIDVMNGGPPRSTSDQVTVLKRDANLFVALNKLLTPSGENALLPKNAPGGVKVVNANPPKRSSGPNPFKSEQASSGSQESVLPNPNPAAVTTLNGELVDGAGNTISSETKTSTLSKRAQRKLNQQAEKQKKKKQ